MDEIVEATLVSPGCVLDVDGDIVEDLRARQHARTRRTKHHGTNSQKSRTYHASSSAQSQLDLGRSSAHVGSGNSSSSMASTTQSGANLSFGASQDAVGSGGGNGVDDSGGSSAQNSQVGVSSASHGILSGESSGDADSKQNAYARANANVDIGETIAQQRTAKVLASQSLLQTVRVVERAVQQNVYHPQHVLYRNFPSLADPSAAATAASGFLGKDSHVSNDSSDWRALGGAGSSMGSGASVHGSSGFGGSGTRSGANGGSKGALEKLWAFQCELTENRRVTCLAWNTVNEDLLAVSYSRADERIVWSGDAAASVIGAAGSGGYGANGQAPLLPGSGTAAALQAAVTPMAPVSASGVESSASDDDGLILFWSLKNPEYPERIYNLGVGVTSIDFSHAQPYLLAVGFTNGVVAIYDTRKDDAVHDTGASGSGASAVSSTPGSVRQAPALSGTASGAGAKRRLHVPVPVATSEVSPGKHLDVLWQVKWISKGSDRGETVVSIASDGRVTEWSMKKGLSYSDLMTLKRVANPLLGSDARADGVISRQASGHCLDFATSDPSVYFVGTEDGLVHKCSVSYNEQYLQTYVGHTGPVYQLLVSPFCSDLFLSCSGDWTIKLWHQNESRDMLTCRSVDLAHAVHGISWCPSDATVFGAVTEDGRIEIWDLAHSTLDPILTHFPKKYVRVPASSAGAAGAGTTASGLGGSTFLGGDGGSLDALDDPLVSSSASQAPAPAMAMMGSGASVASGHGSGLSASHEVPLECTKIAFAPSAPVIVVGDSTGDVTVYRVPALADACAASEMLSADEQVAKLLRAMNPNKHE